ncbi:hypothetical protein [Parapedobacter indicus]|uniref:Uncharacterized protein n=1 Tax=Parapedobacter indicus TaxID=1477437 RepID=A0A1I3E190_9SPHI|nr:hypothetical protein [Parapedobacter indicus]PPL04926.1 hypothetical protein CLV26_101736 [Parapedobacter indicus]SFH92726.1 hypothetical protein SAMN05444682_101722 [Parapedobacter indicus]
MNEIKKLSEILGFKVPIDGLLTALFGRKVIDIVELDRRLEETYRYEGSMDDFIKARFGEGAKQLIDNNT